MYIYIYITNAVAMLEPKVFCRRCVVLLDCVDGLVRVAGKEGHSITQSLNINYVIEAMLHVVIEKMPPACRAE